MEEGFKAGSGFVGRRFAEELVSPVHDL